MFFPSLFFFCKANATCARGMHRFLRRVAVASLLCHPRRRRDDAHRERARGWNGRERERESKAERFFRFPLDENRESEKPNSENGRFFFKKKKKKVLLVVFSNFTTGGRRCFDRAYLFRFLSFPLPEKIDSPSVPELNHKSAPG